MSSCLMALLAAIALSTFLFTADPKGDLAITDVKLATGRDRRYTYKSQEYASVTFNVSADLTPLFNWNTKQLFLYLEAEYENAKGGKNDVVIWDRIVRRKEDAHINVVGRNKYAFKDIANSFKKVPAAHYALKYNVMPYVGALTYGEAARTLEPLEFSATQSQ
ncbi:hypothetical protein HWV62_40567 [Athelia sp. TMB]|nr:hypothetical protein HWV62_40567 [Athelia sp. TMB]